jgi:inner membrane protein
MATPVGHYLLGLSVLEAYPVQPEWRRWCWLLAGVACLPDLDVLPGILVGELARYHHGITHSMGAAAVAAGLGLMLAVGNRWPRPLSFTALLFALFLSHAVLDGLTLDTSEPVGVPLFWPWSDAPYQSPWVLLPNVQHTRAPLVSAHNARLMVLEAMIFLPLLALLRASRREELAADGRRLWLYATWLVVAVAVAIGLSN